MVFCGYSGFHCHDITEILLKVALNTIKQTKQTESDFVNAVHTVVKSGVDMSSHKM